MAFVADINNYIPKLVEKQKYNGGKHEYKNDCNRP